MSKFLSITIPHYKETERDLFPLLSSISGQVGIDFSDLEVIIANDGGSYQLNTDFFYLFNMEIRQVSLADNGGPGVARQAGLDTARGDYVMFCDADDTLHSVGVVGAFIQEARKDAPDILTASWLEELQNPDGTFTYKSHKNDITWMHGKLLRRKFLVKNNIRFHPELRVHEDSYFLCIASALAECARVMPYCTSYVWKYRPDSITRRDGAVYTYASIPTFIKACAMAHAEVEKRRPDLMEYKILQFALYNYFCFHQPGWLASENKQYLEAAEAAFAKHIKPFWHYWREAAPERFAEIYNQERARSFAGCVERETVDAWIVRLGLNDEC